MLVFEKHVLPVFGRRAVNALSRADLTALHLSLQHTPYMANYVVTTLSWFFGWCERQGIVREHFNPARRVDNFREHRRERYLTQAELARLGAVLHQAETIGLPYNVDQNRAAAKHAPKPENRRVIVAPDAIAAIRLLLLTGCRLREILHLQWSEVDFERAMLLLHDSKNWW
jgi:integrase